jgi:hypothetical protein
MMQPLARDEIAHEENTQRCSQQCPRRDAGRRDVGGSGQMIGAGPSDGEGAGRAEQRLHGGVRRVAVGKVAVEGGEIGAFDAAVERQQVARVLLAAAQVMDDRHDRRRVVTPQRAVEPEQRRVIQLILQPKIDGRRQQVTPQARVPVVGEMLRIAAPGRAVDRDAVPRRLQRPHEHPVVEIAARQRIQAAVNHQANVHSVKSTESQMNTASNPCRIRVHP